MQDNNPNPWMPNTTENPYWKQSERIEVQFKDGQKQLIVVPSCSRRNLPITHWRKAPIYGSDKQPVAPKPLTGISRQRAMPTVYKHVLKTEWHRTFTWRERFAILMGASFYVVIRAVTQHNPGQIQPHVSGFMTAACDAEGAWREHEPTIRLIDKELEGKS